MSSQGLTAENVVRSYLNRLATGDVAGILALHTDDSVIDMPGTAALPWAGRWVGIEKIREYFQVLPSVMEIRSHTQRLWVVDGDKVAVTGNEVAACRKTGKEYTAKWCWVFEIRDGKIAVWDAYEDTEAMFNCGPWR
jgi:ketosteroid isomerase-like protein